jgi:hypothetical protein
MIMKSKLVTVEEANRMLPLLRSIVVDIRTSWDKIITKRTELECLEKSRSPKERDSDDAEHVEELKLDLNTLIERINSYIREVEDLGCFVEEFKRGVINFPSLYHGRKVFLCWSLGDETVSHWHELDESYNDRVKIEDTSKFLSSHPNPNKPKIRGVS